MKLSVTLRSLQTNLKMSAANRISMTSKHLFSTSSFTNQQFSSVSKGSKYTTDFKNYCLNSNGEVISYFHDIPIGLDMEKGTVNMFVEIPRWTNGKFEVSTSLPGNPIVQDSKKGKVRYVRNLFPNHGYIHNYGAIPQTWEDPTIKHPEFGLFGDNDPLDACEIGSRVGELGEVKRVKILGSLALVDDGELDWKVIVVDVKDPLASQLRDIHDVFHVCPGLLESTRHWFKNYKLPDGKPQNNFMFNGEYKNQKQTLEVIEECHRAWSKLVEGKVQGENLPSIRNCTISNSVGYKGIDSNSLLSTEAKPDASIPSEVDHVFYFPTD